MGVVASLVVVPPLNCLVAACLGVALKRRWLAVLGLAGLVFFALPVVSGSLIAILESGLNPPPVASSAPQAIVILSGDQLEIRAGDATTYRVGALTLEREQAGAALARRTSLPVLVTGGALHPWSPPLAGIMAASMAQDFNVPVKWQELSSADTWQNATLSAAILHKAGITSVYLVTHAWHIRRAAMAFARFGIATTPAPLRFDRPPRFAFDEFLPHASSVLNSYFALHEWIGIFYYALRS